MQNRKSKNHHTHAHTETHTHRGRAKNNCTSQEDEHDKRARASGAKWKKEEVGKKRARAAEKRHVALRLHRLLPDNAAELESEREHRRAASITILRWQCRCLSGPARLSARFEAARAQTSSSPFLSRMFAANDIRGGATACLLACLPYTRESSRAGFFEGSVNWRTVSRAAFSHPPWCAVKAFRGFEYNRLEHDVILLAVCFFFLTDCVLYWRALMVEVVLDIVKALMEHCLLWWL